MTLSQFQPTIGYVLCWGAPHFNQYSVVSTRPRMCSKRLFWCHGVKETKNQPLNQRAEESYTIKAAQLASYSKNTNQWMIWGNIYRYIFLFLFIYMYIKKLSIHKSIHHVDRLSSNRSTCAPTSEHRPVVMDC